MRRLTPVFAVLALLGLPTTAQARRHPVTHPTTDPAALALKLAEQYWGATPCGGAITVSVTEPSGFFDAGPEQYALENGDAAPFMWTSTAECVIHIAPYTGWTNWQADDETFQWFCDGLTHEMGHTLGYHDNGQTNPRSIQYPLIEPDSPNYNSVPQCQHVILWYGDREFVG